MSNARNTVKPSWQLQLTAILFAALAALVVFSLDQGPSNTSGAQQAEAPVAEQVANTDPTP